MSASILGVNIAFHLKKNVESSAMRNFCLNFVFSDLCFIQPEPIAHSIMHAFYLCAILALLAMPDYQLKNKQKEPIA